MNNLKKLQTMNIGELAEWLDINGHHDAIWWTWFEKTYCDNCDGMIVTIPHHDGEETYYTDCMSTHCAEYDNCKFFPEFKDVPNSKETIKIWLEAEVEDNV